MLLTQNYIPRTIQNYPQQQSQHQGLFISRSDFDDSENLNSSTPSLSSSPLSQYSVVPRAAFSAFDSAPNATTPRNTELSAGALDEISLNLAPSVDLMQSDSWMLGGHLTPKSTGRISHQRESSLSSLGSAGPASPYNASTSNPHIAVTDSSNEGFHDLSAVHDNSWSYHTVPKPLNGAQDHLFAGYHAIGGLDGSAPVMGYPTTPVVIPKNRSDRGSLHHNADFLSGPTRSHPGSVASSTVGGESPATPSLGEPEEDRRRKAVFSNVPKLDRTMTDVYNDELYSPNFTITSASPSQRQMPMSPASDLFAQRLQAANSQHLSIAHSPVSASSRDRSPFRQGSPLAPALNHDFGTGLPSSRVQFSNSGHQVAESPRAHEDGRDMSHHLGKRHEPDTPRTISPKDSMLEFHESETDGNFPLFPPDESNAFDVGHVGKSMAPQISAHGFHGAATAGAHINALFPYIPPQQPHARIPQLPQQYPFIPQQRTSQDALPRLSPSDSSSGESAVTPVPVHKPNGAAADGGTYTCTYHGCTRRFETPAHLQKHKREGHRQAHGLNTVRKVDSEASPGALNSQAGPHRCDRINPSTGKPCHTIFSRPYDLTRHEDTIHNARKQKVRCNLCTEEKTFSRADALTRHYRVCHPEVELNGKQRRRGGQSS